MDRATKKEVWTLTPYPSLLGLYGYYLIFKVTVTYSIVLFCDFSAIGLDFGTKNSENRSLMLL